MERKVDIMYEGLQYIKETLELNEEMLKESKYDTNDMLVSDLLIELGYDRKRSNKVQKIRNGNYDWKITTETGKHFIVKTVELHGNVDVAETLVNEFTEYTFASVITDGETLRIFSGEDHKTLVASINIYSDDSVDVLAKISNDGDFEGFIVDALASNFSNRITDKLGAKDTTIFTNEFAQSLGYESADTMDNERVFGVISEYFRANIPQSENIDSSDNSHEVDRLNEALNIANSTISELTAKSAEQNKEIDDLNAKLSEYVSKVSELTEAVENQSSSTDSQSEIDRLSGMLDEAKANAESYLGRLNEANEKVTELGNMLDEANKKLADAETTGNKEFDEMIASFNTRLREKEIVISGHEKTIQKLNEKATEDKKTIENLHNQIQQMADDEDEVDSKSYIAQIEALHIQVSKYDEIVAEKDREIARLSEKLSNKEDPKVIQSRDLINAIEDDPSLPRSYVGVVNGNLFQAPHLERFIGMALQELYAIVSFELMPFLFDGDIFKITDKVERTDLIINNKTYDIDLSNVSEEEIMRRLKTLFNKFPSVVFFHKAIGTVEEVEEITPQASEIEDEVIDGFGDEGEFKSDSSDELTSSSDIISNDQYDKFDDDIADELSSEMNSGVIIPDFKSDDFDSDELKSDDFESLGTSDDESDSGMSGTLAFALYDLGSIIWDRSITFGKPLYITHTNGCYTIDPESIKTQLQSLIYALALFTPDISEAISKIRQYDFSGVSSRVSSDSSDGVKIPYSKYFIDADNFGQLIPLVQKIAEVVGIQTEEVYVYFEGKVSNDNYADNFVDLSDWNMQEYNDNMYIAARTETNTGDLHCIVSGSVMNSILMNVEQVDMQSKLIKKCIAIRTNYLQLAINSDDDISYIVQEMLATADSPIDDLVDRLGKVIGSEYRMISREAHEVGPDSIKVQLNGDDYYIANMESWQLLYGLINLHVLATGNNSISIRVIMDADLYRFYNEEFISYNPVEVAAVRSFISYASGRLKN